ncbi:hypothetical protein [Arthrobacter antibioticus]|uniref:hypothetical protein n=1 Tax=Arthrobacter sp. H35-MC1 TaxID=3046203 RepID=UPI0024B8E103|nr:hypothetical protein [Arthrobacter sp. H35-MC1]MDJ0315639.1 hypothetical protein [Arthrobacter sp. H35-MC1]
MVVIVLLLLVTVTAAGTVWLIHTRTQPENDPDSTFWYAFTGLCVLLPMIIIPALTSNLTSILLLVFAMAAAITTHKILQRQQATANQEKRRTQLSVALLAITAQHDVLIAQWSRYELDPGAAIEFPSMSDVRVPETSALIRAVAAAARLRPSDLLACGFGPVRLNRREIRSDEPQSSQTDRSQTALGQIDKDDGVGPYQRAVTDLAWALQTAEDAARRSHASCLEKPA